MTRNPLKAEPALIVGAVVAVALLFGVEITTENADALIRLLTLVLPLLGAGVIRRTVTPVARAEAAAEEAATNAYRDINVDSHPGNPFSGA